MTTTVHASFGSAYDHKTLCGRATKAGEPKGTTATTTCKACIKAAGPAMSPIRPDQEAALVAYAATRGPSWKDALAADWRISAVGRCGVPLYQLRNTHGPRWLALYSLPAASV